MIAIILAAGYATRMYPLTENFPKGLLKVNGKEILEHILEDIETIPTIREIHIVTNDKFHKNFNDWVKQRKNKKYISIINDKSTHNGNRLGAVKDLKLVLEKESIKDDILVLASDNLYDFSLSEFVNFFEKHEKTAIMYHEELNIEKLQKTGVVCLEEKKVINFSEKPQKPKSYHAVPPFYIFRKQDLPLISKFNSERMDSPGMLIEWLYAKTTIFAYLMPGKRIDVGSLEEYEKLNKKNFRFHK